MRRLIVCSLAVLGIVVALMPVAVHAADGDVTIIHAGKLLAIPGEAPRTRQSLVIRDGKVAEIRDGFVSASDIQSSNENADATVAIVDLSDHFVLPGLTDLHTHITGELGPTSKIDGVTLSDVDSAINGIVFMRRTLEAGFTTVRNTGGNPEVMFALRRGAEQGKIAGPRIFAAGAAISNTGGHADFHGFRQEILDLFQSDGICDGADDCRRAVRAQIKRGSDWIKITATGGVLSETAAGVNQQLFDDELEAIVQAAALMSRSVAAHAHGTDGINAALRAGVRTIEHGTYSDDESFRLFKDKAAYLVPTMLAGATVAEMAKGNTFMPPPIRDKALSVGPQMADMVRRAHAAGVAIAFGTDSGVSRHGDNAKEFRLLVDAGLSEMEAIVSATITAAEVLGVSDRSGTLEAGKIADVIATTADPLEDIDALMAVDFVMKEGRIYKADGEGVLPR